MGFGVLGPPDRSPASAGPGTPARPRAEACSLARSSAVPRSQTWHLNVLRAKHFRVVVGDHNHLRLIRQIDADDRARDRHQHPQPSKPRVAVAITPGTRRYRYP